MVLTYSKFLKILEMNELKDSLNGVGLQLSYRFSIVVEENIEYIATLKTDKEKIDYIVAGAYKMYSLEQEKVQNDLQERQEIRLKEEKEMQEQEENLNKNLENETTESI